jgi:hypothetical protein
MFFKVETFNATTGSLLNSLDSVTNEEARETAVRLLEVHRPVESTIRTTGEEEGIYYLHIYDSDGSGPLPIFARVEQRIGNTYLVRRRRRSMSHG